MKKIVLVAFMALMFVTNGYAQTTKSNFTIFAENGEKFWLVVNGKKINDKPQYRIEHITAASDYPRIKIIFEDENIPSIDQSIQLTGIECDPCETIYMIKKNKKGYVVRGTSFEPIGKQKQVVMEEQDTPQPYEQEIKHEVKVKTQPTNPSMDVKVTVEDPDEPQTIEHEVKVKVTAPNDPIIHMGPTEFDTEVTIREEQTPAPKPRDTKKPIDPNPREVKPKNPAPTPQPAQPAKTTCAKAITAAEFSKIVTMVNNQSFSEDKESTLDLATRNKCLSVAQVGQLLDLFTFESQRLGIAKKLFGKTVDKDDYYTLADKFTFSSSKKELNDFILKSE